MASLYLLSDCCLLIEINFQEVIVEFSLYNLGHFKITYLGTMNPFGDSLVSLFTLTHSLVSLFTPVLNICPQITRFETLGELLI